MPLSERSITRARSRATKRIAEYVAANWNTVRAAATDLKLDHGTLWRSMSGNNERGPSVGVVTKLAEHSGKSTDYFLGRDA